MDNGTSWVSATTDLTDYSLSAVAFGAGKFVAVGSNGAAMTSVDGATWTVVSTTLTRTWNSVVYGHGRFVIGSNNAINRTLMTSIDGITWTDKTASSGLPNNSINSIIAGPDRFYLVLNNVQAVWYSTD